MMFSYVWYVHRMLQYVIMCGIDMCKYLWCYHMCGNDNLGLHVLVDLVILRCNPELRQEAANDTRQPNCL